MICIVYGRVGKMGQMVSAQTFEKIIDSFETASPKKQREKDFGYGRKCWCLEIQKILNIKIKMFD